MEQAWDWESLTWSRRPKSELERTCSRWGSEP